jgi:hypothetical protein
MTDGLATDRAGFHDGTGRLAEHAGLPGHAGLAGHQARGRLKILDRLVAMAYLAIQDLLA